MVLRGDLTTGFIPSDFRTTISEDGSLRIVNVTKADAGSYTCVATNHFGTASSTGSLVVKGKHPEVAGVNPGVWLVGVASRRALCAGVAAYK